jgi:hypothetical protein
MSVKQNHLSGVVKAKDFIRLLVERIAHLANLSQPRRCFGNSIDFSSRKIRFDINPKKESVEWT